MIVPGGWCVSHSTKTASKPSPLNWPAAGCARGDRFFCNRCASCLRHSIILISPLPALKRWAKLRRPCGTVTWQTPHFYPEPLQFAVITRFVLLLFGGLQRDGFSGILEPLKRTPAMTAYINKSLKGQPTPTLGQRCFRASSDRAS